jgi:hypothetical protein
MSPPIRDGSGSSIGSIRLGDGSEISEVRTGAGDVVFSAIPDSVVSQYKFEQDATDSEGNRDGTVSGATFVQDGVEGTYAANFDGTDDSISLPNYGDTLLTNAFTMIVFFNDRDQATDFLRMWSFEGEYQITLRHSGSDTYQLTPGDYNDGHGIAISNVPSSTWCMLAGRVDYSSQTSETDLYTPSNTYRSDGSAPSSPSSQTNSSAFGESGGSFHYDGRLDNALFADSYLTDSQLDDLANKFL